MTLIATDTLGSTAAVNFEKFLPGAHLVQMYKSAPDDAAYVNRICACHNQVAAG